MKKLVEYRLVLLFGGATVILLLALFWPEAKKTGDMQKYYTMPIAQLTELSYSGEMLKKDKEYAAVDYTIFREENILKEKEPLYRVEIKSPGAVKKFYAAPLIRTFVQDWSEPDYYYLLEHDPKRDEEYGFLGCKNKLSVKFRTREKSFCIGKPSQGDTRRYVLDSGADKVIIMPDYVARRIVGNIFVQREQTLYPHGSEGADLIEISVGREVLQRYPTLREKTGGNFALRLLVKQDGKEKTNVWHVENTLSIKPSHAAEFAQYINGMRVNALLAQDAVPQGTIAEVMKPLGISDKIVPAISGAVKLKKTDKQDVTLTRWSVFAPGVRPAVKMELQSENVTVKPLDALVVSQYNAGYVTADQYPRLLAILTKFENDLNEAAKKGEQEKVEREKVEREKKEQGRAPVGTKKP